MRGDRKMIFETGVHQQFYNDNLKRAKVKDCYSKSLIYVLGINRDTREHFDEIYNVETNEIKQEVINAPFQTSGSLAVTRLAFNLFNYTFYDVCNTGDNEESTPNASKYTPIEIFTHWASLEYLFEGIRIRLERADESKQEIIG